MKSTLLILAALATVPLFAQAPSANAYGAPGTHIIVPEETSIRLITDQPLSTKRSKAGTPVSFTVNEDVIVNHVLAIPRGATVRGEVVENKKAGMIHGSSELALRLDSLLLGVESYPLYAYQFRALSASKDVPVGSNAVQGAYYGAIAGSIVAEKTHASLTRKVEIVDTAAGAAAGAGVVAAASIIGSRPVVSLPAESEMDFTLALPISVLAVTEQEAKQLSQRIHAGKPVLYVRGVTP